MRYPLYTWLHDAYTSTGGCSEAPHRISLTSSSHSFIENVSSVTGVGSSHHEGGSRGCVHCSIGGGHQGTTVNSCKDRKYIGIRQ